MTCVAAGFEGIVGPTVRSGETACYLCYTMRSVALARDPEEDFNFQQFLDSRRTDDGDKREEPGIFGRIGGKSCRFRNTEIADRGAIARD